MGRSPTRDEKIEDVTRVKQRLTASYLSFSEYQEAGGRFTKGQIYSDGDTWRAICESVGISPDQANAPVPDEEYFRRLRQFWDQHGRRPKRTERKKAGLNFRQSRWGSLGVFLEEAVKRGVIPPGTAPAPLAVVATFGQRPSRASARASLNTSDRRSVPPIPKPTRRTAWSRIDEPGFPYGPHDELGVIALFAILCSHGKLPYQIVGATGGEGVDSVCWDEQEGRHVNVEFKYVLSRGTWNHALDQVDLVVCWRSNWANFPKPVIELSQRY